MDNRSGPNPFSEQLWQKLTPCAYDPGKYFLPATSLDEVVQREPVEHMLKGLQSDSHGEHSRSEDMQAHNNAFPADSVALIMQYVFAARSVERQESRKPARKIYAILALMDKVNSLIDFMNAGIYDEHLPLIRDDEEGATFDLVPMIDDKKTSPTCLKRGLQKCIRDFDNYQWYMLPPSFMMKDEQASFYEIEDRAIFPWLAYSPPISAREALLSGKSRSIWRITISKKRQVAKITRDPAMTIVWMSALVAVAHGSLLHSQDVVAVVLPLVRQGGHENLEGKLERLYRHDVFGVR